MEEIYKLSGFLRAFTYLWLTVEFFFTGYIYWNAYRCFKKSAIIKSLENLFFRTSFFFLFLTIVAITYAVNRHSGAYHFILNLIPLPALLLVFAIRNFRDRSLDEGKPNLKRKH